jgi:hypothetical protein
MAVNSQKKSVVDGDFKTISCKVEFIRSYSADTTHLNPPTRDRHNFLYTPAGKHTDYFKCRHLENKYSQTNV